MPEHPPLSERRIPGRRFVPIAVAVVLASFLGLVALWKWGPKGRFATDTAGPRGAVAARIEATCLQPDGRRASAGWRGRCTAGDTLELTVTSPAATARHFTWALFGQGGSRVGAGGTGVAAKVPLDLPAGPWMLVAVVSDVPPDPAGLERELGGPGAPVDPIRGLDRVEAFAAAARREGHVASVTRLPLQLDRVPGEPPPG